MEREHAGRLAVLTEREHTVQPSGDDAVIEIDEQNAALRELRQEALPQTANALAELDGERHALDGSLDRSRTSLTELSVRLSGLVTFFAGHEPGRDG